MKEIGNIYLSWRQGRSHCRHIVGVLKKNASGIRFAYDKKGVEKAKAEGFTPYTEFPEIDKEYTENVVDIFGSRLVKSERSDIQDFYSFWEIDIKYKDNKYYLLAHTQGLLPTDNFEFLADYYPVKELKFSTDLAGLSHLKLQPDILSVGDILKWEKEPTNPVDKDAIKVLKGNLHIGYIKKVHCRVFHKPYGDKLKLTVKTIDKNGKINRLFVKVSF